MDQSLTSFLAKSTAPLSSSVQLRLSHDIALALAHLHSIKIVHRDLSSNNILLIGPGSRAKVCDFGMSKVIDRSKSNYTTPLTMVPGTVVYMPQEALGETPKYTEKLDCFSFGVLVIQIITRLFPNPLPRKKEVKLPQSPTGSVLMPVAETVCRKDHIDLISKTNPLLDIAIECLSLNMDERPPAQELCCRVENLRSTSPSEAIPPDQLSPVEVELELESVEWRAEKRQLEEEIASLRLQNSELAENLAMADYEKKGAPLPSMPAKSVSSTALIRNWRTGPPAPDVVAKSSSAVMTNSMCLCLNHLYAYDVESVRWTQLPKVPYNIMGLHVAYNEKLGKLVAVRNTTVYVADAEQWTVQDRLGFIPWSVLSYETYIIFLGSEGRVVIMEFSSNVLSVRSSIYIPPAFQFATAKICNGAAYLVGATSKQIWLNQVLRIPLDNFLVVTKSKSSRFTDFSKYKKNNGSWQEIASLPVTRSTCVSFNNHLLAVGGFSNSLASGDIFLYNEEQDKWEVIGRIPTPRYNCLAEVVGNQLVVVGGWLNRLQKCSLVEIASLNL